MGCNSAPYNNSEFYQAKSIAARILSLLRTERRSQAEERRMAKFRFHDYPEFAGLESILSKIGPECREIYREIRYSPSLSAQQLETLEARLRTVLEQAEDPCSEFVEELERYLFRPVSFEQVCDEELDDIEKLRKVRRVDGPPFEGKIEDRAFDARLLGLALSGGGVRSATFNLGLLQGMAKHNHVLRRVDYLSTVSGGGYIGGWLAAWIKRENFDIVEGRLCDEGKDPRCAELGPISFLRDYSSYLTPENGLFSADTWTAGMTWIRNTMLNLMVLLPVLAALLVIPRVLDDLMESFAAWLAGLGHHQEETITLIAITSQLLIMYRIGRNLKLFDLHQGPNPGDHANVAPGFGDTAWDIQKFIILPAFLSAWFCANRLRALASEGPWQTVHVTGIVLMVCTCFILLSYLQIRGGFIQCYLRQTRNTARNRRTARFLCFLIPLITAGVKTGLLFGAYALFQHWYLADKDSFETHVAVWGIPLVLADFAFCIGIHIGLMGRNLPDDRREWWSRVAAYLGIYSIGILALFSAAFYGPWIAYLTFPHPPLLWAAVLAWALTTAAGAIAGRSNESAKSNANAFKSSPVVKAITSIAPHVFLIGLFVGVSIVLHKSMFAAQKILGSMVCGAPDPTRFCGPWTVGVWNSLIAIHPLPSDYFGQVEFISLAIEVVFFVVLGSVGWWMSRAVNINEFSMHHFYRNRLIRTFLGASHCYSHRQPNRLTGFDVSDDVLMASLRPECEPGLCDFQNTYTGPYPIFNAALNLVHGERLSWQERKATSFIFSPRFCGYDYFSKDGSKSKLPLHPAGYRPSSAYAYPDGGIHLGTAMAISGAAASPNSGMHTSSAMAFLLTVLNVRLGWWMGNPRHDVSWRRSGPRHGLMYLVRELFGMANDRQRHVYLSDGGHFENLGIYELVRRRCSVIIASDAEEDHAFSFDGLGGVIRKCFVDFGVRIDIDVSAIRPQKGEVYSSQHCASGLIHYPGGWTGTLLYIKASLMGDEPADLQTYLASHPGFPHQSTADQFFKESQFESYHRLGLHVAKDVFETRQMGACEWQRQGGQPKVLAFSTSKVS